MNAHGAGFSDVPQVYAGGGADHRVVPGGGGARARRRRIRPARGCAFVAILVSPVPEPEIELVLFLKTRLRPLRTHAPLLRGLDHAQDARGIAFVAEPVFASIIPRVAFFLRGGGFARSRTTSRARPHGKPVDGDLALADVHLPVRVSDVPGEHHLPAPSLDVVPGEVRGERPHVRQAGRAARLASWGGFPGDVPVPDVHPRVTIGQAEHHGVEFSGPVLQETPHGPRRDVRSVLAREPFVFGVHHRHGDGSLLGLDAALERAAVAVRQRVGRRGAVLLHVPGTHRAHELGRAKVVRVRHLRLARAARPDLVALATQFGTRGVERGACGVVRGDQALAHGANAHLDVKLARRRVFGDQNAHAVVQVRAHGEPRRTGGVGVHRVLGTPREFRPGDRGVQGHTSRALLRGRRHRAMPT